MTPIPSLGTSLGESASFEVHFMKIRPHVFAAGDDKQRKAEERKVHTSHKWVNFSKIGSRPRWTDFYKNGKVVGVEEVI